MDIFEKLYALLLEEARRGRGGRPDRRTEAFATSLKALADTAPAVKPLHEALLAYTASGGDEGALLACAEALDRLRLSLCRPAPPPADYRPLSRQDGGEDHLSFLSLQALRSALRSGVATDALRRAVNSGSGSDARLAYDWLDALESRSLRSLAVSALGGMGPRVLPLLESRLDSLSPDARLTVPSIAAAALGWDEALVFLRARARSDAAMRPPALAQIARLSRDPSDALFISSFASDPDSGEAALSALGGMDSPTAGRLLLGFAEDCLGAQDFAKLRAAAEAIARRRDEENRLAYYAFFTRLMPLLICRPGNHVWLVQTCIDAIANAGTPESVAFLEEMLALAEARAG